jgi:hypothetical protein
MKFCDTISRSKFASSISSKFVRHFSAALCVLATALLLGVAPGSTAQTSDADATSAPATTVIIHSKFGGQIFGFDVDQNGTEGVLAEAKSLANGNVIAAVETFDQTSGEILNVLVKTQTMDDFVTLGITGTSVGLIEHEHVIKLLDVVRTFEVIDPGSGNKLTGKWTPPLGKTHLLEQVSNTQGSTNNAVFALDNSGKTFIPWVFSSNVAANTFGPIVKITDSLNFGSVPPPMAYNTVTNVAVLGGGDGCFGCLPVIGVADLTAGTFTEFTGVGFGFINGIAVDSADNLAVTTTEDDAAVEFYDLATQGLVALDILPNSESLQFLSGGDVEFDATNKLFLVAQPHSSTGTGSSIYVYDTKGVLQESLNGFSFLEGSGSHISFNPATRTGFVMGPVGVSEIQEFTY